MPLARPVPPRRPSSRRLGRSWARLGRGARLGLLGMLGLQGGAGGCAPDAEAPLEVVWSAGGCFSLLEGGRCYTRAEGRVVLWVQDSEQRQLLRMNGTAPEWVEGGWRWTVPIDQPVTLRVTDEEDRLWVELAVQNTADRWREVSYAGARCAPPEPDYDTDEHAFYASGRGRCSDEPARLDWLETAIAGHRDRGDTLRFGWDQANWAQQASAHETPPGGLWLPSPTALEARYLWLYRHATAANAAGNLADAERLLADARQAAVILDREDGGKWLGAIVTEQVSNLLEAGRLTEAAQQTDAFLVTMAKTNASDLSCAQLTAASNRVWLTALGAPPSPVAAALAQRAEAAWERGEELCTHLRDRQWHLTINLAAAALAAGGLHSARQRLDRVRGQPAPDPLSGEWLRLVEAELALASGQPEAVDGLLGALPDRQPPTSTTVTALHRRAQAQRALGDAAAARATLAALEATLPAVVARAPLAGGRGALVDSASKAAALQAELLREAGAPAAALAVLRRQRRLGLLGLQQADLAAEEGGVGPLSWESLREVAAFSSDTGDLAAWERDTGAGLPDSGGPGLPDALAQRVEARLQQSVAPAAAPLPPVAADHLLLLAQPTSAGVHLWWRRGSGPVHHQRLAPGPTPTALPPGLAAALGTDLRGIAGLSWLPMGAARHWPLAALPVEGPPLGTRLPVATRLDLRPPADAALAGPAVVVADPSENLASARQEGAEVAEQLAGRFETHRYLGARADKRTVQRALSEGVGLVHFAGHATFADDGWDAAIHLADEERIAVWELLGLARPPRVVSMTACESSRSEVGNAERLGLAQALLVAGSEVVVAADIPVPDDLSRTFGRAWAAALAEGAPPEAAWVAATRATWQAHPAGPWWAFRLWTP